MHGCLMWVLSCHSLIGWVQSVTPRVLFALLNCLETLGVIWPYIDFNTGAWQMQIDGAITEFEHEVIFVGYL